MKLNEKNAGVDIPISLGQHRIMLGEPKTDSLTRAALVTRGAQKQIFLIIASLRVDKYRLTRYTEPTTPAVFANSHSSAHKSTCKYMCRLTEPLFHNKKNGGG